MAAVGVAASIAAPCPPAHATGADPAPITVELRGDGAPFSSTELQTAIDLRVAAPDKAGRPPLPAVVQWLGDGRVRVMTPTRQADLVVDGRTGAGAARLVALVLADLVDVGTSAPRGPAGALPVEFAAAVGLLAGPGARPGTELSLAGTFFTAPSATGGRFTGTLQLGYVAGQPFEVRNASTMAPNRGRLHQGLVRATGGHRRGPFEGRAGLVLRSHAMSLGDGNRGMGVGGTASVQVVSALIASFLLVAGAGVDVFGRRTEFRFQGAPVVTMPAWAGWLSVGIAWRGGAP